nr:GNAT family N-acetyltransferase [Microbacterium immunditiarum]
MFAVVAISVVPAAEAGWAAVEAVFQSEASSRNCWCQFHVLVNPEQRKTTRESRRELLREQVETLDPPRGLIALDDGEPVGWCGVEPRVRLLHILASKLVVASSPEPLSDRNVWSVYCILVPPRRRRQGIGAVLLHAGVEHAVANGATALEGYPIDTALRGGKLPPGFSTGTVSMFEEEGFERVAALPSARTLVHRRV